MNSLTTNSSYQLCAHTNSTSALQIIRIVGSSNGYFERVVFPGQRLLFEAEASAELEIYTNHLGQATLAKKISTLHLQVEPRSTV